MQSNLVETLIGAIVLVVAAAFLYYGYRTADLDGGAGYTLNAEFDRVDGLVTGSDVRISGIKVGTVAEQSLNDENYKAVVKLSIRPNVRIPDDSSAKITSEGILGSNYVSIAPGGSLDYFGNGDTVMFTQGSVDLMGLISQAIFSTSSSSE